MSTTIKRSFSTRRQAELAVERLVQEHGFERTDIFVSPDGDENSAGAEASGSDAPTVNESGRDDAPLATSIQVSVDVQDDQQASLIEAIFDEIDAH